MATKVHDQADDRDDFAEVDTILAQAKLDLRRDRKLRRNMNLSDIPENFAHVPPCPSSAEPPAARPVSLDTSQPDFASRRDRGSPSSRQGHKPTQKLHGVLGLAAPLKWLRGYMGCIMAAGHPGHCDVRSTVQHHPTSRPRLPGYGL